MLLNNFNLDCPDFQATQPLSQAVQSRLHRQSQSNRAIDAVFWVQADGRLLDANDIACQTIGCSRRQLQSMTLFDVNLNLCQKQWSDYWEIIRQQGTFTFESSHLTQAGNHSPVEISLAYFQHHGEEYGCVLLRDISQRKRTEIAHKKAEKVFVSRVYDNAARLSVVNKQLSYEIAERLWAESELEQSHSLLRSILESTADGIVSVNCRGRIVSLNHKFVEMWQIPKTVLASRDYNQFLAFCKTQIKDPDALTQYIEKLDTQPQFEGYATLELTDGRTFEQYCHVQRLGEAVIGRVWSFRDITRCKRAEAEILQALEQEKELGELRSRFVSMVSHEFRTPLNVISFSASLLNRHSTKWLEDKRNLYFQCIQNAINQIEQLMDAVLIIGRSEAGKLVCEPHLIDLDRCCTEIVNYLQQNEGNQHQLQFINQITNQSQTSDASVDEKLLRPILTNLLSNAIKYSAPGSRIDLILAKTDEQILFQVKDQGIGIPAANLQRLFEAFYRGDNVGDVPGTGLGLAVVQKLVEVHGGKISVESKIGMGTTFSVFLRQQVF
jgi:PAS domain S-box-containing protein